MRRGQGLTHGRGAVADIAGESGGATSAGAGVLQLAARSGAQRWRLEIKGRHGCSKCLNARNRRPQGGQFLRDLYKQGQHDAAAPCRTTQSNTAAAHMYLSLVAPRLGQAHVDQPIMREALLPERLLPPMLRLPSRSACRPAPLCPSSAYCEP